MIKFSLFLRDENSINLKLSKLKSRSDMPEWSFNQIIDFFIVACQKHRNNCTDVFFNNDVLKNFGNFAVKHLCRSFFKKESIKTPFSQNTSGSCLLEYRIKFAADFRLSRLGLFLQKDILKNFSIFREKCPYWSLFSNKL